MRRRPILSLGALVAATALAWTGLVAFSTAGGQEKPIRLMRAHEGSFLPAPGKPVFLLAIGTDARPGERAEATRADSLHIVAIDPKSGSAAIVGIPRDSYVPIPGRGRRKINAAQPMGGTALMTRTVEELSGCRFQYVMLTGFKGFEKMVDEFGGVPVDVNQNINDPFARINLRKGPQTLSGHDALGYARSRKSQPRGDFDRSLHQGDLMVGALGKARAEIDREPGKILKYLGIVLRNVQTEIPKLEALELGLYATTIAPAKVKNVVLDGIATTVEGAGSIVQLSGTATNTLADVCADGVLGG